MAKVFIEESTLSAIGNAIREKEGSTELVPVPEMSTRILAIESGGGAEIPEEAFVLTGDISYQFTASKWDWFLDLYSDKITTKDITIARSTFERTELRKIPFILNIKDATDFQYLFSNGALLTECPKIRGTFSTASPQNVNLVDAIKGLQRVRDLSDLFELDMLDFYQNYKITSVYTCPKPCNLTNCVSIRTVPAWWYKFRINEESTSYPSTSYSAYNCSFYGCSALDEVTNVPVLNCQGAITSNMFSSTVSNCYRLKRFVFETNNGQPIAVKWKAQTLDLSSNVGQASSYIYVTNYNSGITADKEVKDDATYQALKNDPDWFTCKIEYNRYNHDSAVETINSLPDTSAYLTSAGGTNTIKFKGNSGSKTDGGAINTLTAEEIAVAAAKGWTVTLA